MAKTMDSYVFEEGKMRPEGQWEEPGKPEWPSILVLQMRQGRVAAMDLAMDILRQLKQSSEEIVVTLHLVGEMKADKRKRCPWVLVPGVLVPPGTAPKKRQRCTFDAGHEGKCSWDVEKKKPDLEGVKSHIKEVRAHLREVLRSILLADGLEATDEELVALQDGPIVDESERRGWLDLEEFNPGELAGMLRTLRSRRESDKKLGVKR